MYTMKVYFGNYTFAPSLFSTTKKNTAIFKLPRYTVYFWCQILEKPNLLQQWRQLWISRVGTSDSKWHIPKWMKIIINDFLSWIWEIWESDLQFPTLYAIFGATLTYVVLSAYFLVLWTIRFKLSFLKWLKRE